MVFNHFIRNGENYFYHKFRQLRFSWKIKNYSEQYYDVKKNKIRENTKMIVLPKKIGTLFSLI